MEIPSGSATKQRRKRRKKDDDTPKPIATIFDENFFSSWKKSGVIVKFTYTNEDADKLMKLLEIFIGKNDETLNAIKSVKTWEKKNCRGVLLTRDVISILRKCIIYRKYSAAAKVLELLSTELVNRDHVLYKAAFHVLENLPDVDEECVNLFVRFATGLKMLNKREVLLDFINFRLSRNNLELPGDLILKLLPVQRKLRKNTDIDMLLKAYISLYDYIKWIEIVNSENAMTEAAKKVELSAKTNYVTALNEVLNVPGTWDIFVIKLQEVHERYSELDECQAALEIFLKKNPEHLHSHIYLYRFLCKHKLDAKRQLKLLETITKMSPSDPLAVVYAGKLIAVNKKKKFVSVLYDFLDYGMNKGNLKAWTLLSDLALTMLQKSGIKVINALKSNWEERSGYWPAYHFDSDHIEINSVDDAHLFVQKCIFLMCLSIHGADMSTMKGLQFISIGTQLLRRSDWPEAINSITDAMNRIEKYKNKFISKKKHSRQ